MDLSFVDQHDCEQRSLEIMKDMAKDKDKTMATCLPDTVNPNAYGNK